MLTVSQTVVVRIKLSHMYKVLSLTTYSVNVDCHSTHHMYLEQETSVSSLLSSISLVRAEEVGGFGADRQEYSA